ncbi:NAD(P)-binding protein [Roridomyces roridus]|uniref:NAD(P)-binding protein n=1 Tax=Roridomyces roridus TaxID=1738132 RepID=A0AAD7BHQ6_9AGAR|nr:NAD(P)-binding protein [Roridomyces roridus]
MVEEVVELYGHLDVVANAGISKYTPFPQMTSNDWDFIMNVNARGVFLCYNYAGMQMVKQGSGGRIIGASSPMNSAHGITVNAYARGQSIRLCVMAHLVPDGTPREAWASTLEKMHRLWDDSGLPKSTPEDIANMVAFLASKESQFITGQTHQASHILSLSLSSTTTTHFMSKGIALVTWCRYPTLPARGIGKAIALRLAADGFDVAVNDVPQNEAELETLVQEIKTQLGRQSSAYPGDVSSEDVVRGVIDGVVQVYGKLDVMVANAAIFSHTRFPELTVDQWDRIMNVNGRGVFLCYKYAGLQMIKQGNGGRIIGASSIFGKQGSPTNPAYTAAKFAVRGLTQAAALEFGPHGITVNAYAPGAIDTAMLVDVAPPGTPRDTFHELCKKASPLKMLGTGEDVANIVAFIASKESQFITGQTISVNGGVFFD